MSKRKFRDKSKGETPGIRARRKPRDLIKVKPMDETPGI
jgi:hypothetical protein